MTNVISVAEVQSLYDQNRFLEAFRQSEEFWHPSRKREGLSSDELILGGRLAFRLGGRRLSRWLLRAALHRHPSDPKVRYFTMGLQRRGWRLFNQLQLWEEKPELEGADDGTQAAWLSTQAVTWASLRDFPRAHACIDRARSFQTRDGWVFSCESSVYGMEDRWQEALKSAELAWEVNPGAPFTAQALGASLLNLRRIREAAERLAAAAEVSESHEVAQYACWYLCAFAESAEGEERHHALRRAHGLAEKLPELAPLADRETRIGFARVMLDIAGLEDDHAAMERWAKDARSPFHRRVLENLHKNPNGLRIRMPFRRAIQKHEECLPTSIASALEGMGIHVDADAMAREITFGGTPEWAAAQWLEGRGLGVRFFPVQPETAALLVKNGIAFTMTLEGDANAHAVAVVGLDEAEGTLIIHDPQTTRNSEYLLESIGKDEAPLGPKGMAVVPQEKLALLDRLLPQADVEAMTATETRQQALTLHGPEAARKVVADLAAHQPSHPIARFLQAIQNVEDGRVGLALKEFQDLVRLYPRSANARAMLLFCSRSLADTALMRSTLASVVERGILPGIESQQTWHHPPGAYVSEYADLLRLSADTRDQALSLLHEVIRREGSCAAAWHNLGDLLTDDLNLKGALLAYRIAAGLSESNEHYARSYCDALGRAGRLDEGLQWLENRVRLFGDSPRAVATWTTWIDALEDCGRPERAIIACREGVERQGNSAELLAYAAPFFARMGLWQDSQSLLDKLESAGNLNLFHEAAVDFYRRRGEFERARKYAELWVKELPLSVPARRSLVLVLAKSQGLPAALELAIQWVKDHPGHDQLEQLYCQYLDQSSSPRLKKYALLLRRLRRNPEDGWAWRELAFACISDYATKDGRQRDRLARRIPELISQCEKVAPQDAATARVCAHWAEARGEWAEAISLWLDSIQHEPNNSYSLRQIWDCLARSSPEQRQQCWQKASTVLAGYQGRLTSARDALLLAAQRFGPAEAERTGTAWREKRSNDPEVTEALADLLLEHGSGRTDARRALELLQPAVEHFPFHQALRFSFADALRRLGKFGEAENAFVEIVRRHPDNSSARIQIARLQERRGRVDDALKTLATAAERDPQNAGILDTRAQVLIEAGRYQDALPTIRQLASRFPENLHWRERAIRLFVECGDKEAAVKVAREGVHIFPRGAYAWFLLGRSLHEMNQFAAPGEVESCLRRSLALNQGLFAAADFLAMFLVQQRRFEEAESVILRIRDRLADPSAALGRLAWIHYSKGDKAAARRELADLLRAIPWYAWGWAVLMSWLAQDQAWDEARSILGSIPEAVKTNTRFRQERLALLEKAGLSGSELDSEWDLLLADFPETLPLHLVRYDSLRNAKRWPEAAAAVGRIRPVDPESPYVLARLIEVQARDSSNQQRVVETLIQILFAETEESDWPANYAWKAVESAHWEEMAYRAALEKLRGGSRPTFHAMALLASYAGRQCRGEKNRLQPLLRTWLPDRGAREIQAMLKTLDSPAWPAKGLPGVLLKELCDHGYTRLVVKYWKKHRAAVETDVDCWAQTGRALVNLRRKSEARKLLSQWRQRAGVRMWMIVNYSLCLSGLRAEKLREMLATCRDALSGLPHDHCAKYLAHRQAETLALLGDTSGFRETFDHLQNYFNGKLETNEWFEPRRKHLLADMPVMARALQENDRGLYRRMLRSLRWKRFWDGFPITKMTGTRNPRLRWGWIIFWLLWLLYQTSRNH